MPCSPRYIILGRTRPHLSWETHARASSGYLVSPAPAQWVLSPPSRSPFLHLPCRMTTAPCSVLFQPSKSALQPITNLKTTQHLSFSQASPSSPSSAVLGKSWGGSRPGVWSPLKAPRLPHCVPRPGRLSWREGGASGLPRHCSVSVWFLHLPPQHGNS